MNNQELFDFELYEKDKNDLNQHLSVFILILIIIILFSLSHMK